MGESKTVYSVEDAIGILNDLQRSETERVEAVHSLASNSEPRTLESLIHALEDADSGVHWAAAHELAAMGEPALDAVLHALFQRPGSLLLRLGVLHVLRHNKNNALLQMTTQFEQALRGPASDLSAIFAAYDILLELQRQKAEQSSG